MPSNELRLSDSIAKVCQAEAGRGATTTCIYAIEAALRDPVNRFQGIYVTSVGCYGATEVEDALTQIRAETSALVETHDRALVDDEPSHDHLLLRTRATAVATDVISHYVRITAVFHELAPRCRFEAVQWAAFAVVRHPDGSVVLRSDDFAQALAAIARSTLDHIGHGD